MAKSDRWPELCRLVEADDGLPTRECGAWTEDKLYFWNSYIHITTTAMVGKSQWREGLVYVDLFAGPGVCEIRESHKRIPGSPLIAAHAPKPFRRIVAVEADEKLASACEQRLRRSPASAQSVVIRGDCHERIEEVLTEIPERALTLAFIDPEGMDVGFEMLERLAQSRRVDFLLLFADAIDAVRNRDLYDVPGSKMDRMLGLDSGWRDDIKSLPNPSGAQIRRALADIYERQISKRLGYKGFRRKTISGPSGPLYTLIYASRHERGLEFWDKATARDKGGQKQLFDG